MPACAGDNFSRPFWSGSPPISRSNSASPPLPSSPRSTSPPSTLKRSTSNGGSTSPASSSSSTLNSTLHILNHSHRRLSNLHQGNIHQLPHQQPAPEQPRSRPLLQPTRIIDWALDLLLGLLHGAYNAVNYVLLVPALWVSAWICMFWVVLQLPLTTLKFLITLLHTPASERQRSKRCVLISGGSSVQSVRLAQNFYRAGARVVVCELEGIFGLARFSTACSKFYTLPRPHAGAATEYVKALVNIVQKETAVHYVPVSAENAYYDALAKTRLEALGCECFVPNSTQVTALDDPEALAKMCLALGIPVPQHFVLRSYDDLGHFYERENPSRGRFLMLPAGPRGMNAASPKTVNLPASASEFRRQGLELSQARPWLVVRDPGGNHFVTCSTVKDSRLVSNVSCRLDKVRGQLVPEDRPDVNVWLERFFSRDQTLGRLSGHMSFLFALGEDGQQLLPISCRVGIGLPYLCHTSVHPRLVWRPCRHFSRQNSGLVHNSFTNFASPKALRHALTRSATSSLAVSQTSSVLGEVDRSLLGNVLDKKEALFSYWDPLPYCAYIYLQLPFARVARAINDQPAKHKPPLAVVR